MSDVKNAHGELDWYTTDNSIFWVGEYPGIEHSVEKVMSVTEFPLDEELHSNKIIT